MTYSFHPQAEQEFFQAISYYEDCNQGLGFEFSREVFATINRILRFPDAWPLFSDRSRRCLCKRFPYGVIYRQIDTEIVILAVMQLSREPYYANDRS